MSPAEPVTFTLDLEDHARSDAHEVRYPAGDARGPRLPRRARRAGHVLRGRRGRRRAARPGARGRGAGPRDRAPRLAARPPHRPRPRRNCAATSRAARRCSRISPAARSSGSGRPSSRSCPGRAGRSTCSARPASRTRRACSRRATRCSATRACPPRRSGGPTVSSSCRARSSASAARAPVPGRRLPPGAARVVEPGRLGAVVGHRPGALDVLPPLRLRPRRAVLGGARSRPVGSRLLWYNRRRTFAKIEAAAPRPGGTAARPNASPTLDPPMLLDADPPHASERPAAGYPGRQGASHRVSAESGRA